MRPHAPFNASLCWGLVCLISVAALQAETNPLDKRLRELAAKATEERAWPPLRRYAESALDPERRGQAYFVLGYRQFEAREYLAATDNLRLAAETGFVLADFATYYRASAARQAAQADLAIAAVDGFSTRYPGSTLRFEALALLAELLLEAGQPERAIGALTAEPRLRRAAGSDSASGARILGRAPRRRCRPALPRGVLRLPDLCRSKGCR